MNIVAVVAGQSGVERSRRAARALTEAATERGHNVAVETRGPAGVEEELVDETVGAADIVVVAAESAERDRFGNTPLLETTVDEITGDPAALLDRAAEIVKSRAADREAVDGDTDDPR